MLSQRITYLRKKAGLSQSQLAKELNISASAEGMYEQGRRTPSLDMLVMLSTVFDVSLDYLITGSEYPRSFPPSPPPRTPETCPCSTCYWKNWFDADK